METVPEIGGGDWKGPPADSSEVVRWHYQLVRGGRSYTNSLKSHVRGVQK